MLIIFAAIAGFTLQALAQVVRLSGAVIASDGSRIAFVASRVDEQNNRYDDTLEIYDLRSRTMHAESRGHTSVGNIAWSPDGTRLAAVMDDKRGVGQIYRIDVDTGSQSQLTHGLEGVVQLAWDPTGSRLAFTRRDWTAPKHGAAAYQDGFQVDDNAYLVAGAALPDQLWLVDRSGREQRLTNGPLSVMDSPLSWSPDGRFILFERAPAVHGLHDRAYAARLDVTTKQVSYATAHRAFEDQALYSPHGTYIAYLYARDGDPVNQGDVYMQAATGRGDRDVSRRFDRQIDTLAWMPQADGLLEQVDDAARSPLVVQKLDGSTVRLAMGPVVAAAIQSQGSVARDGTIAFVGDEERHPDELYILRPGAASPQRLTSFNDPIAMLALGRVARITWRSSAGYQEDGVLTYPPNFVAGRRYPLMLRIHGGPYETSTLAFSSFYQLGAGHGYLVFAPNYRGSTDSGNAYVRAIFNDPNVGPSQDIMDGIAAVERLGIVDGSRIAVSGWSYGGELTSWLEGHYNIWRAAVAGAAVNDLVVDYSTADDIDADRFIFTAPSPFRGNALPLWRNQSPLEYFKDIKTPTLIFCNVYDVRVPVVESYEMFHALRDNGVPVKFYAYPTSGHLPQGPVREADVYRRWLSWFDAYLK
jgi:dipeptidyl aminopeptidase/acylaminoacyl peptidase